MKFPYSIVFEDLSPELRQKIIKSVEIVGGDGNPVSFKNLYIAEFGEGTGLTFDGLTFRYNNQRWVPSETSLIFVVTNNEIIRIYLFSNGYFYPLNDLTFCYTQDLPIYKAVRYSSEFFLTSLVNYFPIKNQELKARNLIQFVYDKKTLRFIEDGYYKFYIFWAHSLNTASQTKISSASIFFVKNNVGVLLDTCILRLEIMTGNPYYLPTISLQGYYLDKIRKSDEILFRYELTQDPGGIPLSSVNNDGSIYIVIEKAGGVYGHYNND